MWPTVPKFLRNFFSMKTLPVAMIWSVLFKTITMGKYVWLDWTMALGGRPGDLARVGVGAWRNSSGEVGGGGADNVDFIEWKWFVHAAAPGSGA
jgi:hypothetical protein